LARLAVLAGALLLGVENAEALKTGDPATESIAEILASPQISSGGDPAFVGQYKALGQIVLPGYPGGSLTGLFNNGSFVGRFAAGFLGSGLLGLLFGRGLFGGLGGVASYLGLLFQLTLIWLLCRLIWTRWRGGRSPEPVALSPRQLADPYLRSRDDLYSGADVFGGDDRAEEDESPKGTSAAPKI
jgi:hypothetical protein